MEDLHEEVTFYLNEVRGEVILILSRKVFLSRGNFRCKGPEAVARWAM